LKTCAWLLLLAALVAGCGDNEPSSPSSTYPTMVGSWEGTVTTSGSVGGTPASNTCREAWTISSQSAGDFLGMFQTSGGTAAPCTQSGTVNGIVTTGSAVTDIVHSAGSPNTCTRLQRSAMAGVVTGAALSAQSSETLSCSGTTLTRSIAVSMTKR
jgi:hypothetical protein